MEDAPDLSPNLHGPAPEVVQFIQSEQRKAYTRVALDLGLGPAPQKAYEQLTGRSVSAVSHSPYEDPIEYEVMERIGGTLQKALAAEGKQFVPAPCFATLPLSSVNARVEYAKSTVVPVIFFNQGLFPYFRDYAMLIAGVLPSLSSVQLSDDAALASVEYRHTMPFQASTLFVETIIRYVVEGGPKGQRIPEPSNNMPVCQALLYLMESFIMAHEMAHVDAGHIRTQKTDEEQSKQELEADSLSLRLVTSMATGGNVSWGFGYWSCEHALKAINLLYRALAVLMFGGRPITWIDKTHPRTDHRRDLLRQIWLDSSSPAKGVTAAQELCGMSDALDWKLWEFIQGPLLLLHQRGTRPSSIWNQLISKTFVERE